jgi:hypothetical protein
MQYDTGVLYILLMAGSVLGRGISSWGQFKLTLDEIKMYCIIVRRDAWARLLMVIGTP